jgi:hypothetical protein
MKVLLTGGAGFIGQHVLRRLLERGYEVNVLDSLRSDVHSGSRWNAPSGSSPCQQGQAPARRTRTATNRLIDMRPIIPLFDIILLLAPPVAAQTAATAPPSNTTTIVLPDNVGPAPSTTSTTSQTGNADTTVTSVKRENGSTTTVITQQPQTTYQPMGRGGYQPMGR